MLYVCATPIGNLGDVTLRVLEALRAADLIAAEDTRRTRKLLAHYDIHAPLTSLFAHNEVAKTEHVLGELAAGKAVALVTDAGLPGISDPGSRLVAAALRAGHGVTVLPGPSAPLTALVASGLAGDSGFRFVGYLPRRARDLEEAWRGWQREGGAVVAFESPHRLARSLATLAGCAPEASAAVCRELTKLHEEIVRGTLAELAGRYAAGSPQVRGEVTLVIDARRETAGTGSARADLDEASAGAEKLLRKGLSKRDAAAALAILLGVPKRVAEQTVRAAAQRLVD